MPGLGHREDDLTFFFGFSVPVLAASYRSRGIIFGSVLPERDWSSLAPSASFEGLSLFEMTPKCLVNWDILHMKSSNPRRLGDSEIETDES